MAQTELDVLDVAILRELQADGRLSNLDLARRIGLSPAATHARVRRLERTGVIARYVALLDTEAAGFDLVCYVQVGLRGHAKDEVDRFREVIREVAEVQELHHVTGEYDYLLRVALRNRRELERFVVERLSPLPGIARIQTSLVLREVKRSTELPLDAPTTDAGPTIGMWPTTDAGPLTGTTPTTHASPITAGAAPPTDAGPLTDAAPITAGDPTP